MASIKQQLYALCLKYIDERIKSAEQAIQFAQGSANEETKSSSGDKYETGRAMAQLEIEKINTQLNESKKIKLNLIQLENAAVNERVQPGSLVITSQGKFYISIPAGQFTIDKEIYFAISPSSPIAQQLLFSKVGDHFEFNKKEFVIQQIL
ncbi:MAG TPA: 3-oxoacyl-ACP synthase [Cyclobacteriaceae bacterium]|nr:3-oxoacyl-ACP synthase [Cyclobacteriaceae bacterium]